MGYRDFIKKYTIIFYSCLLTLFLSACGFHPQGQVNFAPRLHRLYLQTNDPYGHLARQLQAYLKLSNVQLVENKEEANAVLVILRDESSQTFLSSNSTQQTRQYTLSVVVEFEIDTPTGEVLVNKQTLSESKPITFQSNQLLGSSNEAALFYQQMRRTLAYAIMNRLASQEITDILMKNS